MASLSPGTSIYVDANVLIYLLAGDERFGQASRKLLIACAEGEFRAFISDAVCAEVLAGPYRRGDRRALQAARALIEDSNLFVVLSHSRSDFEASAQLRGERGLGFIDALHVATAENNGCEVLVTNDRGLTSSGIPWIVPLADV